MNASTLARARLVVDLKNKIEKIPASIRDEVVSLALALVTSTEDKSDDAREPREQRELPQSRKSTPTEKRTTLSDAIIVQLDAPGPGLTSKEISDLCMGSTDKESLRKVYNAIHQLKRKKRIKKTASGKWVIARKR